MENKKIDLDDAHRTFILIWGALVASQLLFLVLLYFLKPTLFVFDLTRPLVDERFIAVAFAAVVSIFAFLMSFVRSKQLLEQGAAEQKIAPVMTALITGVVLCDSVSLIGVLLAFAFDYQYFFFWFILGIGGTLLHFPKREYIDAASYKTP